MTIKRQYTLPNCNLILEGMSKEDALNPLAPITMLLNVECQFPGITDPLIGGKDLLEALVQAVNHYGQGLLSGVPRPQGKPGSPAPLATLERQGAYHHKLQLATTDKAEDKVDSGPPMAVILTTVQLFDLVEAVDQFLADTQTLPEMTLALKSVPRRQAIAQEPLTQRLLPAVAGTSTLVAAAAALFFLPVPELEPRPPQETPAAEGTTDVTPAPGTDPPAAGSDAPGAGNIDIVAAVAAYTRLSVDGTTTDPDTLSTLETQLRRRLSTAFAADQVEEPLAYQVAVSPEGEVWGFRHDNDAALLAVESTPLLGLTTVPSPADLLEEEAVALFEVTFLPTGEVRVSPLESPDR